MQARAFLRHILGNEALTRGLSDPEARILVEWLVEKVEHHAEHAHSEAAVWEQVRFLCRRARAIGRFVTLWCHAQTRGAAAQLAAAERFAWPLPQPLADPCEIMHAILTWEAEHPTA